MSDAKQRREHVRQSLKWIRQRIAIAKSSGQEGEAELWQKALAIFARQDKALVRVRTENKRLREVAKSHEYDAYDAKEIARRALGEVEDE